VIFRFESVLEVVVLEDGSGEVSLVWSENGANGARERKEKETKSRLKLTGRWIGAVRSVAGYEGWADGDCAGGGLAGAWRLAAVVGMSGTDVSLK
jgi:hypothetical protein